VGVTPQFTVTGHFVYWTVRLLFGNFAYWTLRILDLLSHFIIRPYIASLGVMYLHPACVGRILHMHNGLRCLLMMTEARGHRTIRYIAREA